jgi:hypothetical protein
MIRAGHRFIVPAIVDYEVRRELERRRARPLSHPGRFRAAPGRTVVGARPQQRAFLIRQDL